MARCGTYAGKQQHTREGTTPCASCKKAASRYSAHWKWAKTYGWTPPAKDGLAEVITDVVCSYWPVAIAEVPALVAQVKPDVNLESVRRVTYRLIERGVITKEPNGLVPR